jgi:hypothetical protein
MALTEIGCEEGRWIELAEDFPRGAVVHAALNSCPKSYKIIYKLSFAVCVVCEIHSS